MEAYMYDLTTGDRKEQCLFVPKVFSAKFYNNYEELMSYFSKNSKEFDISKSKLDGILNGTKEDSNISNVQKIELNNGAVLFALDNAESRWRSTLALNKNIRDLTKGTNKN